jgi:hypothetical protein
MLVDRVVYGCIGSSNKFSVELDIRAANFRKVALAGAIFRAI